MKKLCACIIVSIGIVAATAMAQEFQQDVIRTSAGDLEITFIGHGTLMFRFNGKVIHVDPVGREADYTKLPKADLILVTHEHGDHFDVAVLKLLRTGDTSLIISESCTKEITGGIVMKNGDTRTVQGLKVEAVPAYNIVHMRSNGTPYHPRGVGNGYILTFGDTRVYIAGDTENIPEMKHFPAIGIAFLPMNLPYTMSPEMVNDAARTLNPKILYPYHYGNTDTSKIVDLLKDTEINVRIRPMK